MGNLPCMGLFIVFWSTPSGLLFHMPDYGLTAFMDVDMLNGDLLLASSSVALKNSKVQKGTSR